MDLGKFWEIQGQGDLAFCSPWGCKDSDATWQLNSSNRSFLWGLPWWHSGNKPTCQCRRHRRCRFDPWVRRTERLTEHYSIVYIVIYTELSHPIYCDTHTHACLLSCFSCVRLFVTPWTIASQAPLSMGFSRQEY